jgi:hypothetical protein
MGCYRLGHEATWDSGVRRLERAMQRVLRKDFELQYLQGREGDLLHRTLMLELGDDLSVIASAQI